MIRDFLHDFNKIDFSPLKYSDLLQRIYNEVKEFDSNIVLNYILNEVDSSINDKRLGLIFDIFLKLKSENYFNDKDVKVFDLKIVNIFNLIKEEDIKYYIIGYILHNKLVTDEMKKDTMLGENVNCRIEESKLAEAIIKALFENKPYSAFFIKTSIDTIDSNSNIFKIGELVREKVYDELKIKDLNKMISQVINLFKNSSDNINNILTFILSIYQDDDFVSDICAYNNISELNIIMNKIEDKFLNNLFCEITDKIGFIRVLNVSEEQINSQGLYTRFKDLGAAARGDDLTLNDYKMLNKYLNKTIKSKKKVNFIKMKHSYSAKEILFGYGKENKTFDLFNLMNFLNIQFYEDNFEGDIYGFSFKLRNQNKASIIINKNKTNENRKRFTIAHEIGHICCLDNSEIISDDNIYNMHLYKQGEKQANKFAAELLIPYNGLLDVFNKDISIITAERVADKFGTSLEAAANRIVSEVNGKYIFALYFENNCKYIMPSEEAAGISVSEQIDSLIKESNDNIVGHFIDRCKVSLIKRQEYKYVIINCIYL